MTVSDLRRSFDKAGLNIVGERSNRVADPDAKIRVIRELVTSKEAELLGFQVSSVMPEDYKYPRGSPDRSGWWSVSTS
jgi:hypothetical protein